MTRKACNITIQAKSQGGGGGGPGQADKKSSDVFFLFFLVLSLFYRSQMVNFKGFQGSRGGPTFSRGGGSNCLFPIETHITCDFPGGVQTSCPPPPSGSALVKYPVWSVIVNPV